jgi:integrase
MTRRQARYGLGRIFRHARHGQPYGNYLLEYFVRGVQHRENTGTRDAQTALRLLKTRLGDLATGRPPAPRAGHVTVAELFDDLDADYAYTARPSRRNLPAYRAAWLAPTALGPTALAAEVETGHLQRIVAAWRDTVSDATCNRRLEALRRAYRLGATTTPPKVRYVPAFPPKLPEDNVREGFLTDAIVDALLSHIRARDVVLADFLEWFAWTGMRPGTIRDLAWTAIDRATWTLRLVRARRVNKGKPRYLPLNGPLQAIIERAWARRVAAGQVIPWVFWRRYDGHPRPGLLPGDPVRVIDYRKAWASACAAVGCPELVPYDLRRTAVRNLKRAGVDDVTIMAITGHKTRSMLDRYNIVDTPTIAEAFDRVFAQVKADVRRISPGGSRHRMPTKLSTGAKSRRS